MVDLNDALKASYNDKKAINKIKSQGYNLDTMLSNKNNKVFVNKQNKKLLLSVKGTSNLNDIGTDLYLAVGKLDKTNRFKESKQILKDAKNKYHGYKANLTGHSLGGSIVSKIANKNDKVYAYNEGIAPFQKTRSYNGNHQHIRTQIDPVSILGSRSKHMKTITNIHNPTGNLILDSLRSHNLKSLTKNNIQI